MAPWIPALGLGLASACGSQPSASDDGQTTTTTSTTTSTTASSSSSESTTDVGETTTTGDGDGDPTSPSSSESILFLDTDETDWFLSECDPFVQDCPEGEKCVPAALEGEVFDHNVCVPVLGDGQPGEPCTYGGPVEGNDDCDATSLCWYVDPASQEGTCVPFCVGPADETVCPEGSGCLISNQGSVNVCLPSCDPLLQDCPQGQMCGLAWVVFVCVLARDSPLTGEPCELGVGTCAPANTCVDAEALPTCAAQSCCAEFCDVSDPNFVCSDPDLTCESLWAPDPPPPEHENVGLCVQPAP